MSVVSSGSGLSPASASWICPPSPAKAAVPATQLTTTGAQPLQNPTRLEALVARKFPLLSPCMLEDATAIMLNCAPERDQVLARTPRIAKPILEIIPVPSFGGSRVQP